MPVRMALGDSPSCIREADSDTPRNVRSPVFPGRDPGRHLRFERSVAELFDVPVRFRILVRQDARYPGGSADLSLVALAGNGRAVTLDDARLSTPVTLAARTTRERAGLIPEDTAP